MGKLSDKTRDPLARQVEQRGLVVWYDPGKAYPKLAQSLSLPEVTVLRFPDGFFRLRRALESYLEFVIPEGKPKDGCGAPRGLQMARVARKWPPAKNRGANGVHVRPVQKVDRTLSDETH